MYKAMFYLLLISIFNSCGIQPNSWQPPVKPSFDGVLTLNERLTSATQIDLLGYYGAEEFAIDHNGNLYCGAHIGEQDFRQGVILRISPNDSVEKFLQTDSWVTGLQFDPNGDLLAMMNGVGLVKINKNRQIDTLVSHTPEGLPILMGTGMKIAADGKVYFANMSSTHTTSADYINRIILEMKPTGGVYCYDPGTKTTTTISPGNYFGNGLALATDESYLLISETSKYRILKYWLTGDKIGTQEILIDNLPGFPNNITRRANGHFWLGFTTKRSDQLDDIHHKVGMKKIVYSLPSFLQPEAEKFGMIIEITGEGEIVQALFDPTGSKVMEAGAVKEVNGKLYLGGDTVPYVSKVNLE